MGSISNKQKQEDNFDTYVVEKMSLNKLLEAVSIDIYGEKIIHIDSDVKNRRKKLDKILEKLALQGIIENILNKDGRTINLSVYQRLFYTFALVRSYTCSIYL